MSLSDEARWLRETYDRLPMARCVGCEGCATRCMGSLAIARAEYEAIRDYQGRDRRFGRVNPSASPLGRLVAHIGGKSRE